METGINNKNITIFYLYCFSAIIGSLTAARLMSAQFPVFTFIWFLICLFDIILFKDLKKLGLVIPTIKSSVFPAITCFLFIIIPFIIIEPFSHSYKKLIDFSIHQSSPDLAFIWLKNPNQCIGRIGVVIYLSCIGIFAEELFFRGLLIHHFKTSIKTFTIIIQAFFFMALHSPIILFIPCIDSIIFLFCYTLPLSLSLGWCSYKTGSIWPGVITGTFANLFYFFILFDIIY